MNDIGETPPDLTMLLFRLLHGAKTVEDQVNDALATAGLSLAKWSALSALATADEPLTLSNLAERLACVKSNVTQMIDRLEAEHLVRRTLDSADRRIVRAELTAQGRQQYDIGQHLIIACARQVFDGQSPAELRRLEALLQQID